MHDLRATLSRYAFCAPDALARAKGKRGIGARCVAELTDTFIFVFRHPGLAQIISIDGCNADRLESNDVTDNNALKQRPVVQSRVFMLDISRFTRCGDTRRSGWVSDPKSSPAVRQCDGIKMSRSL